MEKEARKRVIEEQKKLTRRVCENLEQSIHEFETNLAKVESSRYI